MLEWLFLTMRNNTDIHPFHVLSCSLQTHRSSPAKCNGLPMPRLGIFIHWGIYAVDGTLESWAFHNNEVTYSDYMKQINGFRAEHYDPDAWASLISESGRVYAVITSKHHDGVALYPTKMNS
jgi:hypothetical protein